MTERICDVCGGTFETHGIGQPRRRCSDPCDRAHHRQRNLAGYHRRKTPESMRGRPELGEQLERTCPICEKTYVVRQKQTRKRETCGDRACITANTHRKSKAARAATWTERNCVHCGEPIPSSHPSTHPYAKGGVRKTNKDARFCSEICNSAAHALVRKLSKRGGSHRPVGMPFSRAEIAERDRWLCGICGGRVSRERRHPDPLCASIDHIVPLALGGSNDLDNLQLAHLRCNLSKRHAA